RDPTLRRHPCGAFGEPGEDRRARGQVHETGRKGREPGPPIDQPEGERGPGPEPALVVVREELGLVRRDVHVHRAVALASLAREAEVERFLDLLALPAIPDRLTLKHLEEEVRAAAGRVLLLAEHHEARAHRPAVQAPALADADAAQRRTCEAP